MKTLAIGSYSTSTLNPEDLFPFAIGLMESIQLDSEFGLDRPEKRFLRDRLESCKGHMQDIQGAFEAGDEEGFMDWPEVWGSFHSLAGEFCPENHYFGSHPGNGSDFGVWPNEWMD